MGGIVGWPNSQFIIKCERAGGIFNCNKGLVLIFKLLFNELYRKSKIDNMHSVLFESPAYEKADKQLSQKAGMLIYNKH